MIKDFWVLNTNGILLYNRNFTELEKPDDLLAGLKVFIEETAQGEIKNIILKKKKFSYILGEDIIIVILTDITNNDILIHNFLKNISKKFLSQFGNIIKHFNGDTIQFESFYEILEKEIKSSELLVRCKLCTKVIVTEFRIIEYDDEKNLFLLSHM